MSSLTKRTFYLMMSLCEGEDLSEYAGMVPPSPEVIEAEARDVGRQWAVLHDLGFLESAVEAGGWFADISIAQRDVLDLMDPDELEQLRDQGMSDEDIVADCHNQVTRTQTSYSIALIHKLLSEGLIIPARKALL